MVVIMMNGNALMETVLVWIIFVTVWINMGMMLDMKQIVQMALMNNGKYVVIKIKIMKMKELIL